MTRKAVREQLEKDLNVDLSSEEWKVTLKTEIEEFINEKKERENDSSDEKVVWNKSAENEKKKRRYNNNNDHNDNSNNNISPKFRNDGFE